MMYMYMNTDYTEDNITGWELSYDPYHTEFNLWQVNYLKLLNCTRKRTYYAKCTNGTKRPNGAKWG